MLLRGTTEHPNSYPAGRLKSIGSKRNRPTFEMSANAFRLKPWQLDQVDHRGKLNWGSLVFLPAVLLTYQVDPRILGLLDELKGQNFKHVPHWHLNPLSLNWWTWVHLDSDSPILGFIQFGPTNHAFIAVQINMLI